MRVWVVLLLLPSVAAIGIEHPDDAAPTTLFFHVDGAQTFAATTIAPPTDFRRAAAAGWATHSQGCLEVPATSIASETHHTYYGVVQPGPVYYDDENLRTHNERGMSMDARLAGGHITISWFMEAQVFGGDPQPNINQAPPIIPNVVVRATVREGDDISVGNAAFNVGRIIATGSTTRTTLAGPLTEWGETVFDAGINPDTDAQVYGFRIQAPIGQYMIDGNAGLNVRIDAYIEGLLCDDPDDDRYVMLNLLRVHTSPENRPRMEFLVTNPVQIDHIIPQFVGDDLLIHASMRSPWGPFDVGSVNATLVGGAEVFKVQSAQHKVWEHNPSGRSTDVVWIWEGAADETGEHVARVTAGNLQGTGHAWGEVDFGLGSQQANRCVWQDGRSICTVTEDAPQEASPGVFPVLALLGVVLLRRR